MLVGVCLCAGETIKSIWGIGGFMYLKLFSHQNRTQWFVIFTDMRCWENYPSSKCFIFGHIDLEVPVNTRNPVFTLQNNPTWLASSAPCWMTMWNQTEHHVVLYKRPHHDPLGVTLHFPQKWKSVWIKPNIAEFSDCDLPWLQRASVYVLTEASLIWIHYFRPCLHVNEVTQRKGFFRAVIHSLLLEVYSLSVLC